MESATTTALNCYHCGEPLAGSTLRLDNKAFCCEGCKTVYEILNTNGLCTYYNINTAPGKSLRNKSSDDRFAFLDDAGVQQKLIRFSDGKSATVIFDIPQIHCSSCIWLLENLWKLDEGVVRVRVNFLKKTAHITFNPEKISLRALVELMNNIGYAPDLRLDSLDAKPKNDRMRPFYYRLGVAFFCFGNIMLLSFPEYFGVGAIAESAYRKLFGYLNFGLSLPVLLYSAQPFFRSAWTGLRQRTVNMDIPIVLGIIVMFIRSSWEIFSHTGAGYMDTLASLIFLMLVGRMFQNKTYDTLSFERDYKSYFPVAVTLLKNGQPTSIPVSNIRPGDRILIRSGEIIPADGLLFRGDASIDYSFVTGESAPVSKTLGEVIYAGGKQTGSAIEIEVLREVSQSYLTQLWNDSAFRKSEKEYISSMAARVSKWFTFVIIAIALFAGLFWIGRDLHKALNACTAVLIITCPCALALSSPFTLGNLLRIFGRNKVYLKNAAVIETIAAADTIVFDKTGTITQSNDTGVEWQGAPLSSDEQRLIRALVFQSAHPLSRKLFTALSGDNLPEVSHFKEIAGKGIEGIAEQNALRVGATSFVRPDARREESAEDAAVVYVAINGILKGWFLVRNKYREGFEPWFRNWLRVSEMAVLSGDNEAERDHLEGIFGKAQALRFRQSPMDKLNYIRQLQVSGRRVVMVGDGLNDAGALQQSDAGMSITDDINNFSPACDGIIDSSAFARLDRVFALARGGRHIIIASFALSFLYNMVGLYFAVQGNLSPLVAAILMPVSSVTIILFTTIASTLYARKLGFK